MTNTINMIKRCLFALLIALIATPAIIFSQQNKIIISGSVKFDVPGTSMQIYKGSGANKVVVSEFNLDKDNKFSQEVVVDEPGLWFIDCKKTQLLSFWAEDENIEVEFRGLDTAKVKSEVFTIVKGGPKNELINHLSFITFRNRQLVNNASAQIKNTSYSTVDDKNKATRAMFDASAQDQRERFVFLSNLYPTSTSVVALLNYFSYEKDRKLIDEIASNIYRLHPNYAPLDKFYQAKEEAAANARKMEIGAVAPDFEFPNIDGKLFGPKNYRGKIFIIDFWASWCGPCVAEIPNLKKLYADYKNRGLEILSVSIDKDKNEWTKAINSIQMPWEQVLSPNSGKELMMQYQFSMIPFIILIDKDGRIFKKNLRGEALEHAVKELLTN